MSGGKGKLLGGATGVKAANVVILGAGIAGSRTRPPSRWAWGRDTKVCSTSTVRRCSPCSGRLPGVQTLHSDQLTIEAEVVNADVVIGAILVSGAQDPGRRAGGDRARAMQPGSVIVDLSVDQGGCIETSRVHDPPRAHLREARGDPLLRRQHGRGGADHLHPRADQRDAALHPRRRRQGSGERPPAPTRRSPVA